MKTFDWKEKYVGYDGVDVTSLAKHMSMLGMQVGDGTRLRPYAASLTVQNNQAANIILGNGEFHLTTTFVGAFSQQITGTDKFTTYFRHTGINYIRTYLKDLTVRNVTHTVSGFFYVSNCIVDLDDNLANQSPLGAAYNSIIRRRYGVYQIAPALQNITFVEFSNISEIIRSTLPLVVDSEISITKDTITSGAAKYIAFDNCSFLIGNEYEFTKLTGATPDALRANFVARCTAQGITLPEYNEYDENNKVGRWVFSNNSVVGQYFILENSDIDLFAAKRGVYFGHVNKTVKALPITTAKATPNSFTPYNPASQMTVLDNSITLNTGASVNSRVVGYTDSKIVWLGGRSKLTSLNITNNLPVGYGVMVDSESALSNTVASGALEDNLLYTIRSTDDKASVIKYNNVEYSSALSLRNNVFRCVNGVKTFEVVSGSPQIFQVLDLANHSNVELRIVDEIPAQKLTSGNLQKDYWYIVIPNDLADQSGSVAYDGVQRPCFDSFVAGNTLTFAVNGNCHLRRCWHKDFNFDTEATDKAFWTGKQKPQFASVYANDLRTFRMYDAPASLEMKKDETGRYIASGHIDFYNGVNGVSGKKTPAFDITGTFMQIRIPISTLNPM